MIERTSAEIGIYMGNTLIHSTVITPSCRRVRKLMESDYIQLDFKTDEPVEFPLGAHYTDALFGKFYITEEQAPSFNANLHGYDYKLKFNAHYYRWQKHFVCMMRGTKRAEKVWTLTTSLKEQMREFMCNLKTLGYVDGDFRSNDTDLNKYVVIDDTVETEMQALTMSYSSTYMLDALKQLADLYKCEYWIEGEEWTANGENNFKIHFGTCEQGNTEQIVTLDAYTENNEEIPANAQSMSFDRDMSDGAANLLYYFGGTENIPNTYRKELRLKMRDVLQGTNGMVWFNGYKDDPEEILDVRTLIGDPTDEYSKTTQNKFAIEVPDEVLGSGDYQAAQQSIIGDKLIATNFYEKGTDYQGKTLRRFMGIRVCAGCKATIDDTDEVVRVLTEADFNRARQGTIRELYILADLVIYEYNTTSEEWALADYVPLPLSYEQWYWLSKHENTQSYLLYPVDVYYAKNTTMKFSGWKLFDSETPLEVNMPFVSESSARVEFSPYLKNEYDDISGYILDTFGRKSVYFEDFLFIRDDKSLSSMLLSLDNILPYGEKINPEGTDYFTPFDPYKSADIRLWVYGGYQSPMVAPNITFDYLNPSLMEGTTVAFTIKSSVGLNRMDWEKVFTTINGLSYSDGSFYINVYGTRRLKFTTIKEEYEGIKEMSLTIPWSQSIYNAITDDNEQTLNGINERGFAIKSDNDVWITKDSSDTSITTAYKYYANKDFGKPAATQIVAIDISSQKGGNQHNLIAHTADTLEGTKHARVIGFCPDFEEFALYEKMKMTIPSQTLNFKVGIHWGDLLHHAKVGLKMKVEVAGVNKFYKPYSGIEVYGRDTDETTFYAADEEVSTEGSGSERTNATVTFQIQIPRTEWEYDDPKFWDAIKTQSRCFLPRLLVRGSADFFDADGNKIESYGYEVDSVEFVNINDFTFHIDFFADRIDGKISWNSQGDEVVRQMVTENTNIPLNVFTNGKEFVMRTNYDYKVPYKWFTSNIDDPSSPLLLGDNRLQLPIIDSEQTELLNQYGMALAYDAGKTFIVKKKKKADGTWDDDNYEDMAYLDGYIVPRGYITDPSGYFPSEKCVINENIYPMALCVIMKQEGNKGIFTEEKVEYVDVEGESSANRLSYPWKQYHINIGIPSISDNATTVKELQFSKDYIRKNGQPLKVRFLIPEDIKDLVSETDLAEIKKNCKLAGMKFETAFNAAISYMHSGEADATAHTLDYILARNEDFGAKLPSDVLCPSNLDPCVLENWNVKTLGAMGLIDKAEYRLLDKAFEYYKAMHDNNFTITADMMSDWMFQLEGRYQYLVEKNDKYLLEKNDKYLMVRKGLDTYIIPDIGMKVCVKHASLKGGEKHTRVLGYEMKLDKPYDTPKLIMGESDATSRLKRLEKELTKLS